MINSIYQILAIGLKYWFILVAIIMLWLIISTSRREYRERRSLLGQLGNYIGYLEIVGGLQGEKGTRIGISRENTIGSGKTVDIVIRDRSVEREHAFLYLKGNELILSPLIKGVTWINGRPATQAFAVSSGDLLSFGNVVTRLFLRPELEDYDGE